MKCAMIEAAMKPTKGEPKVNEWLAQNSNISIKFINENIVNGIRRISIYYED